MKKAYLFFFLLVTLPYLSYAQDNDSTQLVAADTVWKKGGNININFSQVSLNNWAGGGQSSIALSNILDVFANYDDGKNLWNNKFQGSYGLIRQGNDSGQPLRKSDDLFWLESQYGRRFSSNWMFSAMLNFRSQFYKGEEYLEATDGSDSVVMVSEFMSPAYLQATLGVTYKHSDAFILTLSPLTSKHTIVYNERLRPTYGVDSDKTMRSELGSSVNAVFKKEILKNISFETNLNLFSNYEEPKNIDVNWSANLVLKVNKYITSSITTHLIYDDDIDVPRDNKETPGPATQFKSAINVGFAYSFGAVKK